MTCHDRMTYCNRMLQELLSNISNKLCLAAEEMGVYITNQCGTDTAIVFLISSNGRKYILTCRSPGKPFYPIREDEEKLSPNELLFVGLRAERRQDERHPTEVCLREDGFRIGCILRQQNIEMKRSEIEMGSASSP